VLNVDANIIFEYLATITYKIFFLFMPFDLRIYYMVKRVPRGKRIRRIRGIRIKGANQIALLQEPVSH
jgi:hypothetical protein